MAENRTKSGWPVRVSAEAITECLINAQTTWNDYGLAYGPMLGPNSNTFVNWALKRCDIPAKPSMFAMPVGWESVYEPGP